MYSTITPPSTSLLEGVGDLVVDCELPLAVTTPSQSSVLKIADPENCILVTNEVEVTYEAGSKVMSQTEQKYERTVLDISQLFHTHPSNKPWKLCYVTTDDIEADNSDWGKIASTPGIYVLGKRLDGYHEVIVDETCIPWLLDHNFLFLNKAGFEYMSGYDPTQPIKGEVHVYGIARAQRRYYDRFLENSFKAIWSRRSKGLKLCLRSIAPPNLELALEWAILSNDILESHPPIREKFTLCLVLLALSLLENYNTPLAIQLLEKSQDEVLHAFRKDSTDLLMASSAECQNHKAEAHLIGLTRRVFVFAGGPDDLHQLKFDDECTAIDNLNKLGSLVGITDLDLLVYHRNLDIQAILIALYKSEAVTNSTVDTLDIAEWMSELMTLLQNVVAGPTSLKLIEDTNVPPSPFDYSFDEKISSDRTTLKQKPKWKNRSVRQAIRERFTGPRVECSACGLGRVFSSLCCKLLGNRGYVES